MTLEALFAQAAKHAAFDAQTPENGMPAQAVIENLVARSVPGLRAMTGQGASGGRVRRWDSWATDGHKWLQTPYACGYAIVQDAEAHRGAMTIAASYLPPVADGERDPSHFVPALSRRAASRPGR